MKKLIMLFFCLLSLTLFSQQQKIDSLFSKIDKEENLEKKLNNLKQLVDFLYAYKDKRIDSLVTVHYDLANELNNDYHLGYNLKIIGRLAYSNYDFDKAKKTAHSAIKIFRKIENQNELSGVYYDLGTTFNKERKNLDSARYYIKKRIEIEKDSLRLINSFYQLGKIFTNSKIIDSATIYYDKALEIAQIKNNKQSVLKTVTRLGELYNLTSEFHKSKILLEPYLDSLSTNIRNTLNNGAFLGTLGNSYLGLKNYKRAIDNYKRSVSFYLTPGARKGYNSASYMYFQMAQSALELNYLAKAETYLDSSLILVQKTKFNSQGNLMKSGILVTRSKLFSKKGDIKKSIDLLKDAKKNLAEKDFSVQIEINNLLSKNHFKIRDYKSAFIYKNAEVNYRDSLYKSENVAKVSEIETKYQTEKKEKENLQLRTEKVEQELAIANANRQKWIFAIGLLAAIIALSIFAFYYRKNKKQKETIESLQKELHHRVKNNLSIIDTFIQVAKEEFNDKRFINKLGELQNRIDSINSVHLQLYKNDDITNVNIKKYVNTLSQNIQQSFSQSSIEIENNIDNSLTLDPTQSFPIGLIINEFLTNSFKYAFDDNNGNIKIAVTEQQSNIALSLSDNGKGLPEHFDIDTIESFGVRIMKLLSQQLDGSFDLNSDNGVSLNVQFPK